MNFERLDVFLAQQYPQYSRGQLQKYILAGMVEVNGVVATTTKQHVTAESMVIFREPAAGQRYPTAENTTLTVLYEDKDILVINKPVGMVVHPQSVEETGSLVQAILGLHPSIQDAVYDPENPTSRLRPGIAHRLDKDTSGVIIIAKNRPALLLLAQQFQEHTVEKEYMAVLYGTLSEAKTVDNPIRRKGGGSKNKMGASYDKEDGRAAVSHFYPIKSWSPYAAWPEEKVTLATVKIETGRTHQIRVHAKFIGHPVMGDTLYGNKPSIRLSEKIAAQSQLLHAAKLCINHPTNNERLCFEAPLPETMNHYLIS